MRAREYPHEREASRGQRIFALQVDHVASDRGECPSGGSMGLHCDIGEYGDLAETVATINVSQSEGGPSCSLASFN
jgi:hypothetical protein